VILAARAAVRKRNALSRLPTNSVTGLLHASLKTAQGLLKNPPARLERRSRRRRAVQPGGFAQSSPGQLVTWVMTTLFGVAGFLVYERLNGTARRLAVMPMRIDHLSGCAGRFTLGRADDLMVVLARWC
jgi:hypothetical protein